MEGGLHGFQRIRLYFRSFAAHLLPVAKGKNPFVLFVCFVVSPLSDYERRERHEKCGSPRWTTTADFGKVMTATLRRSDRQGLRWD
jgi:hypothetical protein